MYLIDTNVWLELLLNRARAENSRQFLAGTPSENLFVTDFAFHSIGVILTRENRVNWLQPVVQTLFIDGSVRIIALAPQDMADVVAAINNFNLDFDDAYQYVAAQRYNLIVVSFDADFDRTPEGRRTPVELLR